MNQSLPPRAQRAIADFAAAVQSYRRGGPPVALMVGAGVDHALTGRPLWSSLVADMAKSGGLSASDVLALQAFAKNYPIEAAEALQTRVGQVSYDNSVVQATTDLPLNDGGMKDALCSLVMAGLRLIVTFNYSRDLLQALEGTGKKIIVIDRAHLPAWPSHELLRPPTGNVHVLAIHGLTNPWSLRQSSIVLSRHSYDAASFGSPFYLELLARLFRECHVLSIGMSWTDSTLRDAAARSRFFSRVRRSHLNLTRTHRQGEFRADGQTHDFWMELGFVGSYRVRNVFYKRYVDLPTILASIAQLAREDLVPETDNLAAVADYLDSCGDYESALQTAWFLDHWQRLAELLLHSSDLRRVDWVVVARLERHLRHFLWVYYSPLQRRDEFRQGIWKAIANWAPDRILGRGLEGALKGAFHSGSASKQRGLFDFALGAFEVGGRSQLAARWRSGVTSYVVRPDVPRALRTRVEVAQRLWNKTPVTRSMRDLMALALSGGWEAIGAKLSLDICEDSFKVKVSNSKSAKPPRPRYLNDPDRAALLGLARDTRSLADGVGCKRRESGALVLESLASDESEAESNLLGWFRSGTESETAGPLAKWNAYFGLLAVLVDQSEKKVPSGREAKDWLEDRCGVLSGEGLALGLGEVLTGFWSDFHRPAAELTGQVAGLVSVDRKQLGKS